MIDFGQRVRFHWDGKQTQVSRLLDNTHDALHTAELDADWLIFNYFPKFTLKMYILRESDLYVTCNVQI